MGNMRGQHSMESFGEDFVRSGWVTTEVDVCGPSERGSSMHGCLLCATERNFSASAVGAAAIHGQQPGFSGARIAPVRI